MKTVSDDSDSFASPRQEMVTHERIRQLYGSSRLSLIVNLINAPITVGALWSVYPAWVIMAWLGALYLVIAARFLLIRAFRTRKPDAHEAKIWARRYTVGSTVTGCLWGLLVSVVLVTDHARYIIFVAFVLGGMGAGAAFRDSLHLPSFYGFAGPALLPTILALLVMAAPLTFEMGLLLAIFAIALLFVAHDNNRWIVDAIVVKLDLVVANDDLQRVASDLRTEIHEREQAMAALSETNARLMAIGENAQDGIVVMDSNGDVSTWNRAAERIFGYSSNEIVGRSYHAIIVPENLRAKALQGYERFAATGEGEVLGKTITVSALHKDGFEIPVELSISALRIGGAWHSLGIVRDVRERMLAEDRLKEASRYTRSLIEATLDPLVAINPEGKINDVNDAMIQVTGLTREVLIGSEFSGYFTEPEKARAVYEEVFAAGAVKDYPLAVRHVSGAVTEVLYNASLYRDKNGNVGGVFAAARDVTKLRETEKSLEIRVRQQAAIARLGLHMLESEELVATLDEAAQVVASTLGIEYCEILERRRNLEGLLLHHGVGWKGGAVGTAIVDAGEGSQGGYTLKTATPVIVDDLTTERRFAPPSLLVEHEVVSGMSVVIAGRDGPFGVLGAHTRSRRKFSADDVNFLQAAANVIAAVVQQVRAAVYTRNLIEASLDPLVTISAAGKIIDVNEATTRATGVARETMIGSDFSIYFTEPEKARASYETVFATGFVKDYPLAIRHTSGRVTDVLYNASLYRDENREVAGVFASARDITERRRMELELRQRETELKEAQRLAEMGSWEWLPQRNEFKWSDELYRIFDRNPVEPPPKKDDYDRMLCPESIARWKTSFALLEHSGAPYEIDLELKRRDGSTAWVSSRGQAERDANDRIIRLFGTVQDITKRKIAEQHIAKLHEELSETVSVLRRNEQNIRIITKLGDILQACHTVAEACPVIATTANNLFQQSKGALALVMGASHELETVAQWGSDQSVPQSFAFDDCWALRTGQEYQVRGPGMDMPCRHFRTPPQGLYLCLPLTVYGETTGLLHVNFFSEKVIGEDMHQLIFAFGDVVKLSLANLKLRETLSEQAVHDQLTTLFNRHYLAETLPSEIKRAERTNSPLCIAMLDIDHFKRLNDAHGHDAGDAVLKKVGAMLKNSFRGSDVVYRYGGEEFLLVLPECDLPNAESRVERIRSELKDTEFRYEGERLPQVTMSAGLAQFGEELTSVNTLIAAADEALYAAKQNGRDRIEIFSRAGQRPKTSRVQPSFPRDIGS